MDSRYFGVVLVLFFVTISAKAEETLTTVTPLVVPSSMISMNSSVNATIPVSSALFTSVVTSSSVVNTSSTTSPTPVSTSHVIPSATPTTPPTTKPTNTPKPHGTPTKGRSFDAASFFGGIILGIIVTIACFVGYTWWQNKRKSYHSL